MVPILRFTHLFIIIFIIIIIIIIVTIIIIIIIIIIITCTLIFKFHIPKSIVLIIVSFAFHGFLPSCVLYVSPWLGYAGQPHPTH